jgi:dihydropteroate synthase
MTIKTPNITSPSGRQIHLTRPVIMGILNVTPDSFSDGGNFATVESAVARALEMISQGAAIIDIGGESSRPGAEPVSAETEIQRVAPVIEAIRRRSEIPISIDTYHSVTTKAALDAGADIVNDISALRFDPRMANLVATTGAPLIMMHMLGEPRTMQANPKYTDCVGEINQFFEERIARAVGAGIARDKLILDPGIGFGKRLEDNLDILKRLVEFKKHGLPLLVGASRKSFIATIDSNAPAESRLGGSIAAAVIAVMHGANILRVHDVAETVQAVRMIAAVQSR